MVRRLLLNAVVLISLLCCITSVQAQAPEAPFALYDFRLVPNAIYPGWFQYSFLTTDVFRPEAVAVPTVAIDQNGLLYYVVSDRDTVLSTAVIDSLDDLEQPYQFWIYGIAANGQAFAFASGLLPLKSYIAGLTFNTIAGAEGVMDGRLLVYVKTLVIDEIACPFLISGGAGAQPALTIQVRSAASLSTTGDTGAWDLSGLEGCFTEKLSVLQITGLYQYLAGFTFMLFF